VWARDTKRAQATVRTWDKERRSLPHEAGAGVRTLALSGRPGARHSEVASELTFT
jgi:hypothetical protein